ncbi:hypothetical protein [Nocardia sp. NPDC049149]|uniref:hypothetical protein n=1 Tax=Nocardia sp. NPDC049149 TaxID=3364315 RepID=UPI003716140D
MTSDSPVSASTRGQTPEERMARARALFEEAARLAALPNPARGEAADRAVEAIGIVRQLSTENRSYRRQLAEWCATPVVNYLVNADRLDQAQAVAAESVALFRQLVAEQPNDDDLAFGISWVERAIANVFWIKPALRPKAAELYLAALADLRILAAWSPSYRRQLADACLDPGAFFLAELGRFDEVESVGAEAVTIYRTLASESPGDAATTYRVSWGQVVIAQRLWGKPELRAKAIAYLIEGLDNVRCLAARTPSYRRAFAEWAVWPVSAFLATLSHFDRAESIGSEGISMFRRLVAEQPADDELAYLLSWSEIVVAQHLWASPGLRAKSADLAVRSRADLRVVAARTPSYRRQLAAWDTWPTTAFLGEVGRYEEAEAVGDEAISLYRQLAAETPTDDELAFRVAWSETCVAQFLWGKQELHEKCADLVADSADRLRQLVVRAPSYRSFLAETGTWPGVSFLASVGRFDKAEALGDEMVALYRRLAAEAPGDSELVYRISWSQIVVAQALWNKQQLQQKAAALAADAVESLRLLAATFPSYRPVLADWISWPAVPFLVGTGQKARAIPLAQQAVDIYTALDRTDHLTYGPRLANAQRQLAELQR